MVVSNLNIDPRQLSTLTLPFKTNYKERKEYFLNIHYVVKTAEPFLEKGYDIAYEQIALGNAPKAFDYSKKKAKLNVTETPEKLTVAGNNFSVSFDLVKGVLSNYVISGTDVFAKGPQPGFYLAPTDNDIGAGLNKSLRMWRNVYDENRQMTNKTIVKAADLSVAVVITSSLLNGDAETIQKFIISPDGTIKVVNQFKAVTGKYKTLMRIGNDLQLNPAYNTIQWYWRGPGENYVDRKTASLIGTYTSTVDAQYFPYAPSARKWQ